MYNEIRKKIMKQISSDALIFWINTYTFGYILLHKKIGFQNYCFQKITFNKNKNESLFGLFG